MSKKKRGEDYMKEEDEILRKVGTGNALKYPKVTLKILLQKLWTSFPSKNNLPLK